MFVVIIKIYLKITSFNLKEKRNLINSLKIKLINKFKISVSEVEPLDKLNYSVLGCSFVTNDKVFGEKISQKIIDYLKNMESNFIFVYDLLIENYSQLDNEFYKIN